MEHLTELQLNDYVDGLLAEPEQTGLDAHIADCEECRAEVAALRSVLADVHALPLGVAPGRDLLPDIHAAIDADQVTPVQSWRSRSLWSLRVPLAAAAVLLIISTVVVTRLFERTRGTA